MVKQDFGLAYSVYLFYRWAKKKSWKNEAKIYINKYEAIIIIGIW